MATPANSEPEEQIKILIWRKKLNNGEDDMILQLKTLHNNISNFTIEELKKNHEEIYRFIREPNSIKIDGVNPLQCKKQLIEDAKTTLSNLEKELEHRGEQIPQYNGLNMRERIISWLIKNLPFSIIGVLCLGFIIGIII